MALEYLEKISARIQVSIYDNEEEEPVFPNTEE